MAEGTPIASPITSSSSTSFITSQITAPRCAPNANRTPISFVRRATTNAITPYNPIAASSVASRPNPPESSATNRSVSSVSSSCRPSVFNAYTGMPASSFFTSLRTAAYTESAPVAART